MVGNDVMMLLFCYVPKIIKLIPGWDSKICTVKLMTELGTLFRRLQRMYPLEIYSNKRTNLVSVCDVINISKYVAHSVMIRKYTSFARFLKTTNGLDILNDKFYIFKLFPCLTIVCGVGGGYKLEQNKTI